MNLISHSFGRRRRVWRPALCCGWIVFAAAGCEQSSSPPSGSGTHRSASQKTYIAFVAASANDPYWPVLEHSARAYADTTGTIDLHSEVPAGNSAQDLVRLLGELRDPRLRAVCVEVMEPKAVTGALEQLQSRGIAVVPMMHAGLKGANQIGLGIAQLDDEAIGTALADQTARMLDGAGNIIILHAGADDPIFGPRLTAFDKEMRQHGHIEEYARLDCHGDPLLARQIIHERSERFPRLSAWVSVGDWPTRDLGSVAELGIPPDCKLITVGGTPAQWPLIRSGVCAAIIASEYGDIGAQAVRFADIAVTHSSNFLTNYVAKVRIVWSPNLDAYISDWNKWAGISGDAGKGP